MCRSLLKYGINEFSTSMYEFLGRCPDILIVNAVFQPVPSLYISFFCLVWDVCSSSSGDKISYGKDITIAMIINAE